MNIPFRYQFILAPVTIVFLLACLVAYTLFELAAINRENEVTRHWEILTDRTQAAISATLRLKQTMLQTPLGRNVEQDDVFFDFLEQAGILSGSLNDLAQREAVPDALRRQIVDSAQLLREPERVDSVLLIDALEALLPNLEYQYKIFAAQRRTAFIDNHRKLIAISSRMTSLLLSGLLLCIGLAAGLALWGLYVIRQRLHRLSARAQSVCAGGKAVHAMPMGGHDELDQLERCLSDMTMRLLDVVSVQNVLHGVEHERRRIAMDMHDGVLADLTALTRRVDGLSQQNEPWANDCAQDLQGLRGDVDDIIAHLRCTIDDLHPQNLDILGLESALRSFLARHTTSKGSALYHLTFDQGIEGMLTMEQKITLFRIITEAINNVIRHAHCERFEVCLRQVAQTLLVSVEDNGVGLSADIEASSGHGSANIKERARLIGAQVVWRHSRFAGGTCFELKLPLGTPA